MNKRLSIACRLFALLAVALTGSLLSAAQPKQWREAAANRQRRIIFNNDGNEPVSIVKRPSRQDLLDARTTALKDTQVDSIFYCTAFGSFGVFNHHTKVGEMFLGTEGRYADNQSQALLEAGIDPLAVMVDFCKENDIEIFWSMRMNDTHDGSRTDYGPIMLRASPLKAEHPEYLLGSVKNRPKHGAWTAVDYGRPEIRDLAFRYFEEVCQNYDIDGIELDFFRHPVFFQSTAQGKPATDEDRAAMTELLKRVRTMADEVGQKRGRPILIAVKTPDSVQYARDIGLDIERWMADDLIDLFIPGGYFQLHDWKQSVELGHKYGVKVYPSLDDVRVRDELGKKLRTSNLATRGRAAAAWAAGADGIYFFNHFDPTLPIWNEVGDREKLARLDKDYLSCPRGIAGAAGGNLPYAKYQTIERLNPKNPKPIAPGNTAAARILTGESAENLQPHDARPAAINLRLRFHTPPPPGHVAVRLNGKSLGNPQSAGQWLQFQNIPVQTVRPGENLIEVELPAAAQPATWLDAIMQVRHVK